MQDEAKACNRLAEYCYARAGQVPDRVARQRDMFEGKTSDRPRLETPDLTRMDEADLYGRACELMSELKYREALAVLNELTSRNPQHFMAWYYKGSCCDAMGYDEWAVRAWTACTALKPDFASSYANLARTLIRRRENREAIRNLDKALDLEPVNPAALIDRATARKNIQDLEGAESDLTAALNHEGAPTRTYFLRATVRQALGKKLEADQDLAEGMKQEPQDEVDFTWRGCARLNDSPKAALEDFNQALKLNPRRRPALVSKAHGVGDVLGDTEQAVAVANEMLRLHPYDLNALWGRGVCYARLGRDKEARDDGAECAKHVCDGRGYYHLACLYALLSPRDPKAKQESLRLLTLAVGNGASSSKELREDKDFDPIREDSEFVRLVELANSARKPIP